MLADFYTKPLQGSLFNIFRRVIMGYDDISVIANYKNSEFEERVGKSLKGETNAEFSKIEESKNSNSVSHGSVHKNV